MTNPTRTRAEIQADEAAEIDQQIQALTEKRKALSACWISGYRLPDTEYGRRRVEIQMSGGDVVRPLLDDSVVCIPAADLIPREEHERAVAVAKTTVDTALETLIDPIAFHGGTISYYRVSPRTGQQYRVTVERVVAKNATTDNDHIVDANKMVEPADVEPVAWMNVYSHKICFHDGQLEAQDASDKSSVEIAVPLYRQPVPAKPDANTALGYLVKEYDLDTGHMDTAKPRIYPFDHNGHVYEVVVRRKGEVEASQAVAPVGVVE